MIRATTVVRRPAVRDARVADAITLDHQARHRRRFALTADGGLAFLLDLDKATVLDDGDAVKLEDGRLIRITAAPEALIEVRTSNPLRLMKVAWHLGNRHVPTEITEDALYFAADHVLLEMVRGLGASAVAVTRPFRPEKGAYDGDGHGGHGHHGHEHAHEHPAHEAPSHGAHAPAHGGEAGHVHGPGCAGHDHGRAPASAHGRAAEADDAPAHGAAPHPHG